MLQYPYSLAVGEVWREEANLGILRPLDKPDVRTNTKPQGGNRVGLSNNTKPLLPTTGRPLLPQGGGRPEVQELRATPRPQTPVQPTGA